MQTLFKYILLFTIIESSFVIAGKVNVLYTANINATYKNCGCVPHPLGGLDRLKTYIDNFRKSHKNILVFDGGNIFNSYPYYELNSLVLEALPILNYDLLVPGIHIFFENKKLFNQYYKNFNNKLLLSNCNFEINKSKDFNSANINLRVFSYISNQLFKYNQKPDWLNLKNSKEEFNYIDNGINILIFNGYLENAYQFLDTYNEFDLVLLATDQQMGTWKQGKSIIVGAGHDAESIVVLEINLVDNIPHINVEFVKMDSSISSNESITSLFQNIQVK